MVQVTSPTSLAIDAPQGRKLFVFDRVFGTDVTQEGVWEYVHDCVNAFTQGYNVSLLAYGQSGAGKSYTMGTSGPAEQDDMEIMGEFFFCFFGAPFSIMRDRDGGKGEGMGEEYGERRNCCKNYRGREHSLSGESES